MTGTPIGPNLFPAFPNADHAVLRQALSRFNPLTLASAFAALQVLPQNAKRNWRLGFLAGIVAGLPPTGEFEDLTDADLGTLLNEGSIAAAAAMVEDPPEGPFTEEIVFYGGSYLVGEGLGESDAYTVRQLAEACFAPGALPKALHDELRDCWAAALTLCDVALRGAGLRRNLEPEFADGVEIPGTERLIALQKEMTFGPDRLGGILPPRIIAALQPLVAEIGETAFSDQALMDGAADRRPFLGFGGWIVLARPMALLAALRHRLSLRVVEECGAERLAELFGAAVDRDVLTSLRRMAMESPETTGRDAGTGFTEISAPFDKGKTLHALIITDDFEGLTSAEPYTVWDGSAAAGAIDRRISEIEAESNSEGRTPLLAVLMQPAGRQALLLAPGGGEQVVPTVLLTAADLETIAVNEAEDPLALWKFASAVSRLGATSGMGLTSMLDVYGAWSDGGRSFGAACESDHIGFMPGFAGPERIRAARGRDRHGVPAPGNALREVERRTTPEELDVRDRIYYESGFAGARLSISVSGAALGLWVTGPPGEVAQTFDAVESVAYWLGELTGPLADLFNSLASELVALEVLVDFDAPDYWFEGGEDPGGDSFGSVQVVNHERVALRLGPALRRNLPQADNAAERELVALLIDALAALAAGAGVRAPGTEERETAREAAAPLGLKKHLIQMPAELNRALAEPQGPPRIVQEADRSEVRYRLGRRLYEKFGYRDTEVSQDQRGKVLNEAVEILFKEISATFDGCRDEGLLEFLMAMVERLIATAEHRRAILPARLETYPQAAARLRGEAGEANLAAICARFLVEYAAAAAPAGEVPISLALYDGALASAAELVDWADLSDAIYGGLSGLGLRFDRDGILRTEGEDRYESGRSHFFDRHIAAERRRSERGWAARFEAEEAEERPRWLERVDPLFVPEAGVPLHVLGETLVAANHVAMTAEEDVVALGRGQAVSALAQTIDRDPAEIEKAIDYMALAPRSDFLQPPDGAGADVYPWRYARRWSYNRRPFVRRIRPDGEEELLWGQRQVFVAFGILYGQIENGRYQELATAPELKSELGRLADQEGAEFEERVAVEVEGSGLAAARSVKRLGEEKLQRSATETLGDIDVLTADPARKTIWAIECKSLLGSLGSSEVVLEMTNHFDQEGTTSVTKHAERVAWLGERILPALERLGLTADASGWQVRGLVVTERDVIAPFIDDLPFPSVPFFELAGFLADPPTENP